MNDVRMTGGSDTTMLARALGWLVAIPFFAAGVMTALLEFDVTTSPPRETPPNDLVEGTLAFFENESERWPQELISLLLFTAGFLALIGLVVMMRNAVSRDDPRMLLGTLAVGVGRASARRGSSSSSAPRRSASIRTTATARGRRSRSSAEVRLST